MDTLLTGIVDWKLKTVYVNGSKMEVDSIGGFSINVSEILSVQERVVGVEIYLNELEQMLTFEQIKKLYSYMAGSMTMTITDVSNILNVDKGDGRDILNMGISCGVLCKGFNSAWRVVDKVTKDRLKKDHRDMIAVHKPTRNAEDILHENIERSTKENEGKTIQEEYIEGEEPAQIKVGMKGVAIHETKVTVSEKKTPVKLSALVSVLPSVQLPKKKPLPSPTQDTKKPQKSAKIQKKKTVVS